MGPELRSACAVAIHVLVPDGRVLAGGRATLFILGALGFPGMRLLALPPFVWGVELGYGLVARNRRFVSRFLFRNE